LPVGDVLPGAVIPVFLGQTEVDKKELVAVASDPHQEVIRLDIPAKKRGSNFADFVPVKIYLYLPSCLATGYGTLYQIFFPIRIVPIQQKANSMALAEHSAIRLD
jgi:hypothetical protein